MALVSLCLAFCSRARGNDLRTRPSAFRLCTNRSRQRLLYLYAAWGRRALARGGCFPGAKRRRNLRERPSNGLLFDVSILRLPAHGNASESIRIMAEPHAHVKRCLGGLHAEVAEGSGPVAARGAGPPLWAFVGGRTPGRLGGCRQKKSPAMTYFLSPQGANIIGAEGLTAVFGMGTGVSLPL